MSAPSVSRTISCSGERTIYTNECHRILLSGMAQLQKEKMFTDVILCCGDVEIHAHKVVLAGAVEYFRSMFTMGMQESSQGRISLENVDATSLEAIVDFLYSGQIYINSKNVKKLIETANFLNVKFIVDSGGDFLANGLKESNCLGILQFADTYGIVQLREKAKECAMKNMPLLFLQTEFFDTTPEIIIEFLSHEYLYLHEKNVIYYYKDAETSLFKACLNYVRINESKIKWKELKTIFLHLRFHQLDADYISKLLCDPIIMDDQDLVSRLVDAQHNKEKYEIKPRIPSNIHNRKSYGGMAMTNGAGRPHCHFDAKPDEGSCVTTYVSGVKLGIRLWDNQRVVGGLGIFFSNGQSKFYGNQDTQETYEFNISYSERIVRIEASSDWMIDSLSFITNTGKKFGPYGGDGGDESSFSTPSSFGFLSGFSGAIIFSQESQGITFLQPIWSYFRDIEIEQSRLPNELKSLRV